MGLQNLQAARTSLRILEDLEKEGGGRAIACVSASQKVEEEISGVP